MLGAKERRDGTFDAVGLENADKMLDDFWNAAHSTDKLSCCVMSDRDANIESVDGKELIVVKVPRANRRLRSIYVNGNPVTGIYRRDHKGNSDPRNETMMKMFTLISVGERAGGGIPDMVKKWMDAGYGKSVLSERVNPERSSIFLPLVKRSEPNISSNISSSNDEINLDVDQAAVLDVMRADSTATYPEIARKTGFSESEVYRISSALQKKGIVERVGSRKTGTWKVLVNSSMLKRR